MTEPKATSLPWKLALLRLFSFLSALEGVIALGMVLDIPADPKNVWLWGYSRTRIMIAASIILLIVFFFSVAIKAWRNPVWASSLVKALEGWLFATRFWLLPAALCVVFFVSGWTFLIPFQRQLPSFLGIEYYQRLFPLVSWVTLLSAQTLFAILALRSKFDWEHLSRKVVYASGITLAVFLLLWGWVAWTDVGLEPDDIYWGVPGVPVLAGQVFLALLFGLGYLGMEIIGDGLWKGERWTRLVAHRPSGVDVFIGLLIWIVAAQMWIAQPAPFNYFSPRGRLPNMERYPYSDAAVYDSAGQMLLIGEGFERSLPTGDALIPRRAFYSELLALLNLVAGPDINRVIAGHVILIAALPVLVYLLTAMLHHRASGVLVAVLLILRERNGLALSGRIPVVQSKMFMSDLPTALGVVLIALLILLWLQKPQTRPLLPLVAGGVLGATMLIRTQSLLLIPFIILIAALALRHWGYWTRSMLFLGSGLILFTAPLLGRNWQVSGGVALESSQQSWAIIGRYAGLTQEDFPRLSGETESEYSKRMMALTMQFIREHPLEVAGFVGGQMMHNVVTTVIVLPASLLLDDLGDYVDQMPMWTFKDNNFVSDWSTWTGEIGDESRMLLFINLVLVSVGIGTAWGKYRFAGLVPLVIGLGYMASNSAARISGWRFQLPADWVVFVYYGIGLIQIAGWLWYGLYKGKPVRVAERYFKAGRLESSKGDERVLLAPGKVLLVGGIVLLFGFSLPLTEWAVPPRYADLEPQALLAYLEGQGALAQVDADELQMLKDYLEETEEAVVLWGRALYPKFYTYDQGDSGSYWPSFAPRKYNRLGFHLIGPREEAVVLPMFTYPQHLPHAADVLVFGYLRGDHFEAVAVIVLDGSGAVLIASPPHVLRFPIYESKAGNERAVR